MYKPVLSDEPVLDTERRLGLLPETIEPKTYPLEKLDFDEL